MEGGVERGPPAKGASEAARVPPGLPYVLSAEDVADEVVRGVMDRVLAEAEIEGARRLDEIAYRTLRAEQSRLAEADTTAALPPGLDPSFVSWLRLELANADCDRFAQIVRGIVDHYVREIGGHFDRRVYRIATRVVPPAVSALLHGARGRGRLFDVDDRILIEGEVDALRALARVGTVILAPTHVSNLDSLVMGSVIHRLGLPPFAYGAGINLFTGPLIGFFMRHLGAYTIDRQKTDPLYRATLKEYAALLLARGQHTLLFPGGTRSRSGRIESKIKLGLAGDGPARLPARPRGPRAAAPHLRGAVHAHLPARPRGRDADRGSPAHRRRRPGRRGARRVRRAQTLVRVSARPAAARRARARPHLAAARLARQRSRRRRHLPRRPRPPPRPARLPVSSTASWRPMSARRAAEPAAGPQRGRGLSPGQRRGADVGGGVRAVARLRAASREPSLVPLRAQPRPGAGGAGRGVLRDVDRTLDASGASRAPARFSWGTISTARRAGRCSSERWPRSPPTTRPASSSAAPIGCSSATQGCSTSAPLDAAWTMSGRRIGPVGEA